MTYCKLGEKPTVTYSFKNSGKHTYKTDLSPIDVQVITVNPDDVLLNQCRCERYFVGWIAGGYLTSNNNYYDDLASYTPSSTNLVLSYAVWGEVKAIRVVSLPNGGQAIQVLCRGFYNSPCQENYTWQTFYSTGANSSLLFTNAQFTNIIKNPEPNKKCGDLDSYCEIYIKHNNKTLFQDRGLCPIAFDVQCGDCPKGTIKCNAPGYPGYCCLPCTEIAGEIKAIASQVRRINNV